MTTLRFQIGPSELLNSQRWKIIYSGSFNFIAISRTRKGGGEEG